MSSGTNANGGPSLTDAMKNFVSLRLAEALVVGDAAGAPPSAANMQAMARAFLRAGNGLETGAEKATRRPGGRDILARPGCFAAASAAALESVAAARADGLGGPPSLEQMDAFLAGFESSFKDGHVTREEVELGEVVWAADYAAALRERGVRRAERAKDAADGGQQQLEALVRHRMEDSRTEDAVR